MTSSLTRSLPAKTRDTRTPPERLLGAGGRSWLEIAVYTYLLLTAVAMVSSGFKLAAGEQARVLFDFAKDPITGLVIGVIATALVQSSSTVSSITVGLVAGGLPVATAVPIIMGANLGTTLTNTLVSLGHVRESAGFRRAFAAATVHDFFNLLSLVLFLPLEVLFHPLERMAKGLAGGMVASTSVSVSSFNALSTLTSPPVKLVAALCELGLGSWLGGALLALLGVALILFSITSMGRVLKAVMVGRAKRVLHSAIGRGPLRGILSGTAITMLVQSSSTTTSLTVPLVGSGVFSVRDIYPFVLGANIGTCLTALMAALSIAGHSQQAALQIALVHLLYNVLGVVILFGTPGVRNLPIWLAESLATLATKSKALVACYVLGTFFVVPGLLLLFVRG